MSPGWPATLQYGAVTLRPLRYRDARAWRAVRRRNAAWLLPWDATVPPGGTERPATFLSSTRLTDWFALWESMRK